MISQRNRCPWVTSDPLCIDYHDQEWGVPVYEDRLLFEFLVLEGAQAGLNWMTVLKKRAHYRKVFAHFDINKVASYADKEVEALLKDPGIIRNRLKVGSAINNAKACLCLLEESSLSDYFWKFVDGQPIQGHWQSQEKVPSSTAISDQLSRDLKQRGFNFVGTTICYAFMQAVGMVNDHLVSCFCYTHSD